MEEIATTYEILHALAGQALEASNKGHDDKKLAEAAGAMEAWRRLVTSKVDVVTRVGFNTVQGTPYVLSGWPVNRIHVWQDYQRMELQMNWLVQREQAGKVTINITGSHNNVATGNHNKQGATI